MVQEVVACKLPPLHILIPGVCKLPPLSHFVWIAPDFPTDASCEKCPHFSIDASLKTVPTCHFDASCVTLVLMPVWKLFPLAILMPVVCEQPLLSLLMPVVRSVPTLVLMHVWELFPLAILMPVVCERPLLSLLMPVCVCVCRWKRFQVIAWFCSCWVSTTACSNSGRIRIFLLSYVSLIPFIVISVWFFFSSSPSLMFYCHCRHPFGGFRTSYATWSFVQTREDGAPLPCHRIVGVSREV